VILGYLIVGMLLGMIAAAISLFLGSSLLWALIMYSVVGGLGTLLLAAIVYALSRVSEHGSLIKTCKQFLRGD
jgi:hypothetical protein